MTAYYNEIDPYAAQWLRNLIAAGHIAPGDVDTRSIADVLPSDLAGYTQCHFFAGIGGWSYAARLAGWPDDRPLWTGSCPCQPFSVAGKGAGEKDERHLWPVFFGLIDACRPPVVMGEQVAAAVGKDWLDGVSADLEGIGYACGAAVVPACAVDAPHRRDRLWFVADATSQRERSRAGQSGEDDGRHFLLAGSEQGRNSHDDGKAASGDVVHADNERREELRGSEPIRAQQPSIERAGSGAEPSRYGAVEHASAGRHGATDETVCARRAPAVVHVRGSAWSSAEWIIGADGKARRVEPGIRLLSHGVPARVGRLRAYGNAIVPQVAAEIIGAYLDAQAGGSV